VIHYHGTPITPRAILDSLAGRSFCVSHAAPQDLRACLVMGQSLMLDNGAWSQFTRGHAPDWRAYYDWCAPIVSPSVWAVVPDTIGGTVEDNLALAAGWPFPRAASAMVWHLHEPLDHLRKLANEWPRICFGSSGEYAGAGGEKWRRRVDEGWDEIVRSGARPWVHMLRAMSAASEGPWPFDSADSTNIARNHAGSSKAPRKNAVDMANRIDATNPPRGAWSRPERVRVRVFHGVVQRRPACS
jgi:hypothetical protein